MWRRKVLKSFRDFKSLSKRDYLTEAYKCKESWAERLSTPILQKVNMENYFYELDNKFTQLKKISPVDVDVYTNKVTDDRHMDEMGDLLRKLRSTEEATNVFDSSQHALIRNYLEFDNFESLVQVLNHRFDYGVFLDNYSANLVLDKLIEGKNFKLAARIATIFALQEDFSHPITANMSLFACYNFLEKLETFDDLLAPVQEEQAVENPKDKKKKIEEIKVRVNYLRNPYFDDHFDLKNTNHLLGKTFLYLAEEFKGNEALANSLKLLGYSLYEKFENGNQFLAVAKSSPFFKETVEIVKTFNKNYDENEQAKQFFESINTLSSLKDGKVAELIESSLKKAVQDHQAKDIEDQKKIYKTWIEERDFKLNEEIRRHNRIQRLLNIEKIQEDLKIEEKKLWFFENEDKIDLEIDDKRVYYPKRWFGKKKKPRVVDENYIPPDVDKRRNVKN
jgi:small subunit ribosomal protein S27